VRTRQEGQAVRGGVVVVSAYVCVVVGGGMGGALPNSCPRLIFISSTNMSRTYAAAFSPRTKRQRSNGV